MKKLMVAGLLALLVGMLPVSVPAYQPVPNSNGGAALVENPQMTEAEGYKLARWVGMGKEVVFEWEPVKGQSCGYGFRARYGQICIDRSNDYNGWFGLDEFGVPHLHIIAGANVPKDIIMEVIFHEVGHYKQWLYTNGDIDSLGSPYLEWEADTQALNALCSYYHDSGKAIDVVHRAWQWLKDKFGYDGSNDWRHGTTMQRMTWAVGHAESCKTQYQAP